MLEAIETVPRELFVEDTFADQAYADQALPISCGQTISQPFIVAFMTDRLQVNDRHTGAGDRHRLGLPDRDPVEALPRVCTIERYRTLADKAGERFKQLKLNNVTQMVGDGTKGWPSSRPSSASS